MITPGIVIAYHGCDGEVGEGILSGGREVTTSTNDYDWLGSGAYFWEGDPARALEWARSLQSNPRSSRGKIRNPFVIGAIVVPGRCLDLIEADSLRILQKAYRRFEFIASLTDTPLPQNLAKGEGDDDLVKRHLDCAVINYLHAYRADAGEPPFDTVRCPFFEGSPIFTGSKIATRTHIQWCIREPSKSIVGYFRVKENHS